MPETLKGVGMTQDFRLQVFFHVSVAPSGRLLSSKYPNRAILNFSENSRRYLLGHVQCTF
jgi:hypothetical protein